MIDPNRLCSLVRKLYKCIYTCTFSRLRNTCRLNEGTCTMYIAHVYIVCTYMYKYIYIILYMYMFYRQR